MRKRKKLIIAIFSLLLCVIVTFAWINEIQNPKGVWMELALEEASVENSALKINLYVNVEDPSSKNEKYEILRTYDEDAVTESETTTEDETLKAFDNFAPGSRKKFKVEITNKSSAPIRMSMVLSDIFVENEALGNCIIIGTNGFEGFSNAYPAPDVETKLLSEGMSEGGGFSLVELVELPPKISDTTNNTVTIYFYVMFSASGTAELEGMSFSIGKINFLSM